MATFMYLFRSNPEAYRGLSPEQMQQHMQKWMNWKAALEQGGHLKQGGGRLDSSGKVVRGKARSVTDGPFIEVKDFVQGQLLIEAKDLEQAVELSVDCPVLESDGSVEIRPMLVT